MLSTALFPALEIVKKAELRRSPRNSKRVKYGLVALMTVASQYIPMVLTDTLYNALHTADSLDLLSDQTYNGSHFSKFVFKATSQKASDNETYT